MFLYSKPSLIRTLFLPSLVMAMRHQSMGCVGLSDFPGSMSTPTDRPLSPPLAIDTY